MKIKLIVKLSIIFYTTTLFGADKEQIIKKVVSYTGSQQKPSTEYILNTFKDKRLQIDSEVLERFKNKPEKIKTYEEYKKIFFNEKRIGGGVVFYKKNKTLIARIAKEFEIDPEGKTATDAGIERYATKIKQLASGSNVPVEITQADKDLAKKRMLGDPEDPTTGTGKYGGRMSKQMAPKTLQKLRTKLKTQGFIGDKEPDKVSYNTKDRVTVNTSDTDKVATPKPKPSKISMVAQAARKNPAAALAAYDLGKGIIGKITKLRMPSVQGGKAGFRSAGG